jgi:hypothetical protein
MLVLAVLIVAFDFPAAFLEGSDDFIFAALNVGSFGVKHWFWHDHFPFCLPKTLVLPRAYRGVRQFNILNTQHL